MPLTPVSPNPPYLIPQMFAGGQPASAATFNNTAQVLVNSIQQIRHNRGLLDAQVTSLESAVSAAGPNFAALLADATATVNNLNTALAANTASLSALSAISSSIVTDTQAADIQLARFPVLQALLDSLTIGGEIQGYSDILNRIATASLVASRILGTDASGNIIWRTVGSLGSGVLLKAALFSRRLTDTAAGGAAASLQAWNTIQLDVPSFNNVGIVFNNTTKEFNIPAGEYIVMGFCVGSSNGVKCRLRNIGASTVIALSNPAKGTTASGVVGSQPVNFVSKLLGAFFVNSQITADFQYYYDTAAALAANTQGATANLSGYSPQQSALVILRIVY